MRAVARFVGCLCFSFVTAWSVHAQLVTGIGNGGNIPANAPAAASGTFTSNAVMNGGGTIATGNAVTVILKGLQHDWSGDLIATLSYLNAKGNVIVSANLFYHIGQSASHTEGSWATFGAPGPTGDNYTFNTDAPGNIWSVASGLGYADVIPGLQTDTVNNGQYFTSDAGGTKNNLSYAFAGLDIGSGTWQLTITDASNHAAEGSSVLNTGSLVGWELDIQTASGPKNFAISVSPASQNVAAGNTAQYTVTLSPINGFSGPVTLSASGLPAGASAAFTSNPVTVSSSAAKSTVTVSTTTGVPAGSYTLNVTGQSGSIGHSGSATLAVSAAPNSITVTPSSGSGASQTFSFAYTSADQSQEHFFFNNSLTGVGACYLLYERPSNSLYIVNDQGTALSGPVTPGGSGTLSNSQCSVPAFTASVSVSGNTVTITVTITFSSSFGGAQKIYANIVNDSNLEGTWQQIGTWTVLGGVTNSITVTPSSGSGVSQAFSFAYTNTNQSQEHFFFNGSLSGVSACYVLYERSPNALYLVNDQGTALIGPVTPGGSGTLSNSQCSVPASTASVSISGATVTVKVIITFASSFTGAKNIYATMVNDSNAEGTWQQIGSWTP